MKYENYQIKLSEIIIIIGVILLEHDRIIYSINCPIDWVDWNKPTPSLCTK